jgi:cysteine desulfurase
VEHLSIIDAVTRLTRKGWEITPLRVDENGLIDPEDIFRAVRRDTVLVCVTAASDELGTIEPVEAIAKKIRGTQALLHVDAVAAAGHIPLDMRSMGADSMSISGPPMYAPAGIGALIIRSGVRFAPMIIGGGGEEGRRGGAPNLIGAAGLGAAAGLCAQRMPELELRIAKLRDRLINGILKQIPKAQLIGHQTKRLPGHAAFIIPGAEGEAIARQLDLEGVRASSGSLCARWALKPSHVLAAIGIHPDRARDVIQFTLGDGNDERQVDYVLDILPGIVSNVRDLS